MQGVSVADLAFGFLIAFLFGYLLIAVGRYFFGARKPATFAKVGVIGAGLSTVISFDRGMLVTILPALLAAAFFVWQYRPRPTSPADPPQDDRQ